MHSDLAPHPTMQVEMSCVMWCTLLCKLLHTYLVQTTLRADLPMDVENTATGLMSIRFPILCNACKLRCACLSSAEPALKTHLAGISVLAHESGSYSSIKRLNSILIQLICRS